MTIIIGIICKESIVVASDSQTTYGTAKRCDAQKIVPVMFKNGTPALVAQAGEAAVSARAIEIFKDLAAATDIAMADQPARCLEEAIRILRKERISFYGLQKQTAEDIQRFLFEREDFSLMLAYYWNNKPQLSTLSFTQGIAQKDKNFSTLGCGANVASFVLSWSNYSDMFTLLAMAHAIFVIEEVKKVDAFCGGPTQLAEVNPGGTTVFEIDDVGLQLAISMITKQSDQLKCQWAESLDTTICEITRGLIARGAFTEPAKIITKLSKYPPF